MSKSQSKPWFLANEKKDRSSFWKTRESGYSTSNYWLKDSIFDRKQSFFDEDETIEKASRYDHFQLAQYQRAIGNFVRILTGRADIRVKYNTGGNENYTDGSTITLSPSIKEKEFDTAVGLALHEASHIVHTDFDMLKSVMNQLRHGGHTQEAEIKKTIHNIVEDLYIDAMTYRSAPGYRGYYSSLYQKFFGDNKIVEGLWSKDYAEPTWNNYLFHLCNIRNPQRNLKALPGLEDVFKMLDLPNITRLSKNIDRWTLTDSVYDTFKNFISATDEFKNKMNGQGGEGGQGGEDGEGNGEMDYETLNELLENMDTDGEHGNEGGGSGSGKFVGSNGVPIQEGIEGTNYLELDKLSDKAKKNLEKLIEQQKNFFNGETKKGKMSKADQNKIDAFASVEIEKVAVGSEYYNDGTSLPLYIIRDLTKQFVESVGRNYGIHSYTSSWRTTNINEGINRGKMLAKKLQLRNEERVMKSTRLNSGKIDKRLLHEIGFDNYDIFSKININAYKPSFIHISLDQSGSMEGTKWENTMQVAAMFATASKYINNIRLVITTRSTFSPNGNPNFDNANTPFVMTIFDSKKHTLNHIREFFPRIHPIGLTPEGLALEGIMKETLDMAQGTDAYFINICDGEPYMNYVGKNGRAFSYAGENAKKHSQAKMRKFQQNGVKFLTYYIGNQWDFKNVQECYGEAAVLIERPSDVARIAATMNKKLLAV